MDNTSLLLKCFMEWNFSQDHIVKSLNLGVFYDEDYIDIYLIWFQHIVEISFIFYINILESYVEIQFDQMST
jgi:hypothetical protein